jgi:hypothetical protein
MISDRDLDALRRALDWGRAFQKREPQLKLFPEAMPVEGTRAWFALALRLAAIAQSHSLGLKPWQVPPIDVDDAGWDCKPEEIALRQTMRDLNISIYEPDVPTAIANATHQRAHAAPTRRAKLQAKGK